ncbi:MAG TPA: glutamate synthase large subunit [Armatimonadota bacterium]|nr:glutamate synthase large subunit [Armatimonadota bacterium]
MACYGPPRKQGLYDPANEHDACGIGFVCDIHGRKSNAVLRQGLEVLLALCHRGASGAEPDTGDGAGVLIQLPHAHLQRVCSADGITLPAPGHYGVGMVFLPQDPALRAQMEGRFETIVAEEGLTFLGWRTVPTDNATVGQTARACEPVVRQCFIARGPDITDGQAFERKLFVARKRAENAIRHSGEEGALAFYFASLSSRTIVYKGMLTSHQVEEYYTDLSDPAVETAICLVHSRFSTNTFPSWDRAHPYRLIIHNGEINTLRGNVNWMRARQAMLESDLFGDDLKKVLPVIDPEGSDSAMFDNCLEFLTLGGYSLPQAVMMMIPEPWSKHEGMSDERRAFYEYFSCLMEPWDGPASIGFTDGIRVGAVLDRNGLRPSRYYVTRDGLVVLASEVGVLDIPADQVLRKGRLQPGRMFLVDTEQGTIVGDDELKTSMAAARPYRQWLDENLVELADLPPASATAPVAGTEAPLLQRQHAFGYTYEDLRILMAPMARDAVEPLGSMGNDVPLAVLSERPQLLFSYFKQLFAQVTNPPIDAIREEIITALETTVGSERNLLSPEPASCRMLRLPTPIISDEDLARIRQLDAPGLRAATFPIHFDPAEGGQGLESAMAELCARVDQAIADGVTIVVLSDRGVSPSQAPIPSLLAVSGLHHHLVRNETRTRVGIVLESGEPREVHHFAVLIGYGCGAINPYLACESVVGLVEAGLVTGVSREKAVANYLKAAVKGVVKVMSKMGISTVQSYRGAQIFEAVGLNQAVIERYFSGTASRIGGIGLPEIAREAALRHQAAFARCGQLPPLDSGGHYQWRRDGEHHLFNPESIHALQYATRTGSYEAFGRYSRLINEQSRRLATLRGLLEFRYAERPIPIDEVESVDSICKRFKTGAMSFGSISREAHECLAIAMNRIGGKSNTGEGGEDPARFVPDDNGDSRCSAIKQVASGRFGVTSEYLVHARELQIKMAQGAKPGEGGQLPGRKVYPWIARVRHSTPGVGLISPPPHHDIYSIEDLAELIHDLKNANPHARVSVKLVSEVGVGTIAAGVAKGKADVVLISGYDGGTGASPQTSIKHAGLPWELGLAETHQTLVLNNLRSRIVVETDGQLKTGRDVAIAALLGAEEFGFATAPLVVMGCVMMRVCHMDTCPVGVATQNPELRGRFTGDPQHVVHFMQFVAQELREIMAQLGFRTVDEMVGRVDRLEVRPAIEHWKAKGLDFSQILHCPDVPPDWGRRCQMPQDHGLDKALDTTTLLPLCEPALERGEPVEATLPIRNVNRVVGTLLGSEVTRRYGAEGLPDDTITLRFHGSAGQSFGAFIPRGITLVLEGDSNDYIGKGLSGGKIVVRPPAGSTFVPEENTLIGNVALYGATRGEAYFRGMAGERFCVRNSGALAVVEGVGDHGCEYMTGGRVVVLGATGRNFAAGMSGGIAYVLDPAGDFASRCNLEMVELCSLGDADERAFVEGMITRHAELTGSDLAWRILADWDTSAGRFVKVYPKDYRRAQEAMARIEAMGLSGDEAVMAAFEENKRDVARVSGS